MRRRAARLRLSPSPTSSRVAAAPLAVDLEPGTASTRRRWARAPPHRRRLLVLRPTSGAGAQASAGAQCWWPRRHRRRRRRIWVRVSEILGGYPEPTPHTHHEFAPPSGKARPLPSSPRSPRLPLSLLGVSRRVRRPPRGAEHNAPTPLPSPSPRPSPSEGSSRRCTGDRPETRPGREQRPPVRAHTTSTPRAEHGRAELGVGVGGVRRRRRRALAPRSDRELPRGRPEAAASSRCSVPGSGVRPRPRASRRAGPRCDGGGGH